MADKPSDGKDSDGSADNRPRSIKFDGTKLTVEVVERGDEQDNPIVLTDDEMSAIGPEPSSEQTRSASGSNKQPRYEIMAKLAQRGVRHTLVLSLRRCGIRHTPSPTSEDDPERFRQLEEGGEIVRRALEAQRAAEAASSAKSAPAQQVMTPIEPAPASSAPSTPVVRPRAVTSPAQSSASSSSVSSSSGKGSHSSARSSRRISSGPVTRASAYRRQI